jgi:ferritin
LLSERFVDALNQQIAREFAAAHQYVGIGAHYAAQTFPQLSSYFYEQAEEEREHAMKMVNYLLDREANVHFGAIEEPRADFPRPCHGDQARARAREAGLNQELR